MYILSALALLKVICYYDLSVLSMSVMGFKKKSVNGLELYPIFFGFLELFQLCKAPYALQE